MADAQTLISEVNSEIKRIESAFKKSGSTYSLIVEMSKMTVDLLRVVSEALETEHKDKAYKLHKKGHALHKKLMATIPMEDLHILSKHGNTDADWIISSRILNERSDEFRSEKSSVQEAVWSEYLHHLERGVFVYKMDASPAVRLLFLSEKFLDAFMPNIEKAVFYLDIVCDAVDDVDSREAHYKLFEIYFDKLSDAEKAKYHLQASADLNYPDALAAYGQAHWGNWLVEEDERKGFKLVKKASDLGSSWGSELLATAYSIGMGTKKNAPKSFKIRMSLGEEYDAENCAYLAEHFLNGVGVAQDKSRGNKLLKKAMKMGSGFAHYLAAKEIYWSNNPRLAKKRFEILRAACELDDPYVLTFNDLGTCYFHGDGTKQDFDKAKECFQNLLELGGVENVEAYAELYLEALDSENPEEKLSKLIADD